MNSNSRHRLGRQHLSTSWGSWLGRFGWSFVVTLTFAGTPSVPFAKAEYSKWIRRVEQRFGAAVSWFMVVERSTRDRPHIHALIYSEVRALPAQLKQAWKAGFVRAVRYDPALGATFYLSKTIGATDDDYELSHTLPPLTHPSTP